MVQYECPKHWKPTVSFTFEVGRNPLFQLLALWGNKNCPPSVKVKKMENSENKRGLMGCKWSSLNAQALKTLCFIQFQSWVNSHFPILALWGNKNSPPSMKVKKLQTLMLKWSAHHTIDWALSFPRLSSINHFPPKFDLRCPFPIWQANGATTYPQIRVGETLSCARLLVAAAMANKRQLIRMEIFWWRLHISTCVFQHARQLEESN